MWEKPEPIPRSELLSRIPGVEAVYCVLTDKIDDEVLDAAGPQLKVVASMSVGVDHLDLNALKKRDIRVGYTPGVLTDATAELIVALLLATSRRLLEANRAIYKCVRKKASQEVYMGIKVLATHRLNAQIKRLFAEASGKLGHRRGCAVQDCRARPWVSSVWAGSA